MSKLAREKQDAEQFIRQIAPEYLGVYVVDRETDEFRDILAPAGQADYGQAVL